MKKLLLLLYATGALAQNITYENAPDYNKLVAVIYRIEGGEKADVPYGIHIGNRRFTKEQARVICQNTCRNNYKRWKDSRSTKTYFDFLADRYCPPSADPQGNANWKRNVKAIYNRPLL